MKMRATAFFLLFLVTLFPVTLSASVSFTKIAIARNYLTVSLFSDSTNTVNIGRILEDGLNLKVTYSFTLYKRGAFMIPDELVSANELVYDSRKDLINNGYETEVRYKGDIRGRWFSTVGEMSAFLMGLENFRVLKLSALAKDTVYYLEVKQSVTSLDVVPPLSFIYSLFGSWNYVSKKTRSKFFTRSGILHE